MNDLHYGMRKRGGEWRGEKVRRIEVFEKAVSLDRLECMLDSNLGY